MAIPDSLTEKIELYKNTGHLTRENNELFSENSWLSVLEGQGQQCAQFNPLTHSSSDENLSLQLNEIEKVIQQCAAKAPSQEDFLKKYCQY